MTAMSFQIKHFFCNPSAGSDQSGGGWKAWLCTAGSLWPVWAWLSPVWALRLNQTQARTGPFNILNMHAQTTRHRKIKGNKAEALRPLPWHCSDIRFRLIYIYVGPFNLNQQATTLRFSSQQLTDSMNWEVNQVVPSVLNAVTGLKMFSQVSYYVCFLFLSTKPPINHSFQ